MPTLIGFVSSSQPSGSADRGRVVTAIEVDTTHGGPPVIRFRGHVVEDLSDAVACLSVTGVYRMVNGKQGERNVMVAIRGQDIEAIIDGLRMARNRMVIDD